MAERRHELPQGGHPLSGGLRGDGGARPAGGLQEPRADDADLDEHVAQIQHYIDLGFNEVYVHNVGRNQSEFIRAYGRRVIPALRWPS